MDSAKKANIEIRNYRRGGKYCEYNLNGSQCTYKYFMFSVYLGSKVSTLLTEAALKKKYL